MSYGDGQNQKNILLLSAISVIAGIGGYVIGSKTPPKKKKGFFKNTKNKEDTRSGKGWGINKD